MRKSKQIKRVSSLDDHITDEMLLSAADGELGSEAAAKVRSHLEACWSCRVRKEKIEHAIEDLVDYRAALLQSYLQRPGGPRAILAARLREFASNHEPERDWRYLLECVEQFARTHRAPRIAWAGALVTLLGIAFLARMAFSPTVSASELLERAKASERVSLGAVKHPVVYRKLRIHSRTETITRTIYQDTLLHREAESTDAGQTVIAEMQRQLQAGPFTWQDPLSVPAFIAWRSSLPEKSDEIEQGADGQITLQTKPATGPVSEVDLTLRGSDYHAVAETLRFQNSENIEISEVAFRVLAFEAVNPSIFEASVSVSVSVSPPLLPTLASLVPRPSLGDLEDAEVEARLVLHQVQADLGEQIDFASGVGGRTVVVSGMVDTTERKQELVQALRSIPYMRTRFNTLDVVTIEGVASGLKEEIPSVSVESAPFLESQLEDKFPDAKDRTDFVNRVLEHALAAVNRAWSLRRLSEKYNSDVTAKLDIESQHKLGLLIRDDVGALQQELDSLGASLTLLMPDAGGQVSEAPVTSETYDADWHWGVDSAFSDTQLIQSDVTVLLGGSANEDVDAQALMRSLQLALTRMERRLPALCQQLNETFLTAKAGVRERGGIR